MMNNDIYNDGSYIEKNKTLHREDSLFKFQHIQKLLEQIPISKKVKVLDVGGGAGEIGRLVCEYFIKKDHEVEFYALDLSSTMLEVQKETNPYIKKAIQKDVMDIDINDFDITLMIDVIEHIPQNKEVAKKLNDISKYIIYNIPTEINLFDKLRDIYMKKSYYKMQTESIGHLHFFSYLDAIQFLKQFYSLKEYFFVDYSYHIMTTQSDDYKTQRDNKLRLAELKISNFLSKFLRIITPYIIQGSLFALVKQKGKNE